MADAADPKPYHEPSIPFAEQKSVNRSIIAHRVGERLDRTAGLWRLGSSAERPIQLYLLTGFLTGSECSQLCAMIDQGSYPSPLYEKDKYEGVRTSSSCNLDAHDPLVKAVDGRISELLGIDRKWGEPLQGQRYAVGQEFRDHSDFFYIDQPYWAEYSKQGGQRTWTAMAYLNEPERGGGTAFPFLDLNVTPRTGSLLIWNNMALDGSPNPWTMHCGRPVEAGSKYVVTKWFRERPFG